MKTPQRLSVRSSVNPPVSHVSDEYVDLSIVLHLNTGDLSGLVPTPAHLVAVSVGQADDAVLEYIEDDLGLDLLGDQGQRDSEGARPAEDLAEALRRLSVWAANESGPTRGFIFINEATFEDGERLGLGIERAREAGVRIDIFGLSDTLDFRLLSQVALMAGGRFFVGQQSWREAALAQKSRVETQAIHGVKLGVRLIPNLVPLHAFCFDPSPRHVRDFQVQPADDICWFDLPPISSESDQCAWVLRCLAPRKLAGSYRLLRYEVEGLSSEGAIQVQGAVEQDAKRFAYESSVINPEVESLLDRARPTQWVEEIGQAFIRGDGGQIVSTFTPFMQHESLYGREESLNTLWRLKCDLIRGGYFGLGELNVLWRIAHTDHGGR